MTPIWLNGAFIVFGAFSWFRCTREPEIIPCSVVSVEERPTEVSVAKHTVCVVRVSLSNGVRQEIPHGRHGARSRNNQKVLGRPAGALVLPRWRSIHRPSSISREPPLVSHLCSLDFCTNRAHHLARDACICTLIPL